MPKQLDITLGKIRNRRNLEESYFLSLYRRLVVGEQLGEQEYIDALRFGVLFSRSDDDDVRRLGYRIFLQYGELTLDYEPVYAVASSRDIIPLAEAILRLYPSQNDDATLDRELFRAHSSNFVTNIGESPVYRTRGQMELRQFNAKTSNAIVVAPTSYGKSEMLLERLVGSLDGRNCVLVPSRALISQTRANIISDARIREARIRVITHPEAYNGEDRFIAVMTQERLLRLLLDNPALALDQLLVDEAHNLLGSGTRAIELSQAILITQARNADAAVAYYTPFLASTANLRHFADPDGHMRPKSVNEHIKVERIFVAEPEGRTRIYDQFLNTFFDAGHESNSGEVDVVLTNGGTRTLVYVNRPRDAQDLAARLAAAKPVTQLSTEAERAIAAISDLIDPTYALIESIRHGVVFHHGQVPDLLRNYVEELFRTDTANEERYLVTTSTLLEGVNTPADRLILMTGSRGRSSLSRSAFKNLVGRVGRFNELFSPQSSNLSLLQPRIYLIPSSYSRKNWNVERFLESVANVSSPAVDIVENPLLIESDNPEGRDAALEYLENVAPEASFGTQAKLASTEVGLILFRHGVRDFDILDEESAIQQKVNVRRASANQIETVDELLTAIVATFLADVELDEADALARVRDTEGAQSFYSMFLEWRSRNEPFKVMINHFVRYWSSLSEEYVYVGNKWGEVRFGGFRELFVQMEKKTRAEMINLAVVKIKEEQDFVDFRLLKYVEVLNDLGFVSESLYLMVKYGTDDASLICLLRNGFSPELARIVNGAYAESVRIDVLANEVAVLQNLPFLMQTNGENDIRNLRSENVGERKFPRLIIAPMRSGHSFREYSHLLNVRL